MRQSYGPEYPRTLGALMAWSELDPTGPAVTDAAGTLDRRAFQTRVRRFVAGLRKAGVGPGARVALWLPNGADYLATIFACARLDALAIHVNTRFRTAEVGSLLRRSRALALVTQWGFPSVDFPAIFAALPPEDRVALRCVLSPQPAPTVTQLAGLPVCSLESAATEAGPDEASGEKPCLTFTTSGTTGGPKLVLHDQQTLAGHAVDVARGIGLDAPDAVLLGALPFCGTFGNVAAMAAIAGGAHIVCLAQFNGETAVGLIRAHRVTHVIGGDDMFGRLAAAAGGRRFETVRFSGFAAFHSSAAVSIAAAQALGSRMVFTEVRRCRPCSRSRTGRTACSAAACPSILKRGLRCAIRRPPVHSRLVRPASCGSTHRLASLGIWKIRRRANARSTPMACFAPAISPACPAPACL